MKKNDVLAALRAFPYDPAEYWLITGGAMVVYGFRGETGDVDLGCTSLLADRLEKDGYLYKTLPDGSRQFKYGEDIEIFENWLCGGTAEVEGFRVITPEGLIEMKRALGREKDLWDVSLIEAALAREH